jgi:hypothetical protein
LSLQACRNKASLTLYISEIRQWSEVPNYWKFLHCCMLVTTQHDITNTTRISHNTTFRPKAITCTAWKIFDNKQKLE